MEDKRLFTSFLIEKKWRYITGILLLAVINLLQLLIPRITGNVVNLIVERKVDGNGLLSYGGIIMGVSVSIFALHYLSRLQIMGASNLFDYQVRNRIFSHLLKLSMRFFYKNGVGEIMALAVNDIGAIRMAMGRGITLVASSLFLLISGILVMSRSMNLTLTLLMFIPYPFLIFLMGWFGSLIHHRFKKVQESFAGISAKAQENISGIRVVKAFVQEENEMENFTRLNRENYKINMRLVKIQGFFHPLIAMLTNLSYLIVLYFGGRLVLNRSITLGDFIAFNSYIGILIRPAGMIGMIISFLQRARASSERINALLDEKPEITDDLGRVDRKISPDRRFKGKIEFRNVTFSYDEGLSPALKNISFTLEPGKTIGITGRVGSGKSTVASLILRIFETREQGKVFIDGIDITRIPLMVLRNNIGYVPQDNFLFSATIADNISFSPDKADQRQVEEAAKASCVYDDITGFPDQFQTILGERGVNLSGGQKQRVSIARALIRQAPILILDDCLSAVDTETERKILEGLKSIRHNRTCIIIAHRISAVRDADEILVLENGEIAERGSHDELMANSGIYSRMYERQLLEDAIKGIK